MGPTPTTTRPSTVGNWKRRNCPRANRFRRHKTHPAPQVSIRAQGGNNDIARGSRVRALSRRLTDADSLVTSEGTVYPLLTRIRKEGLVETLWEESPQGPPRRYYRLTDASLGIGARFPVARRQEAQGDTCDRRPGDLQGLGSASSFAMIRGGHVDVGSRFRPRHEDGHLLGSMSGTRPGKGVLQSRSALGHGATMKLGWRGVVPSRPT